VKTLLEEIFEQPEVLHRCLDYYRSLESWLHHPLGRKLPATITFTGMGASLYASLPAVYYLNARGFPARYLETAELLYYQISLLSAREWLVVISQSGETVELRRLLARLRRHRPRLAAITNNPQSTLGRQADLVLPLQAGEQAFASTKTYTASVVVALLLAALWSEGTMRPLLDGLARDLKAFQKLLAEAYQQAGVLANVVSQANYVALLGRGPSLASAQEGALLFKEVCARPAEGMTGAEFRHGPLELLAQPLAAVLFAPGGPVHRMDSTLRRDLVRHGARVLWISPSRECTPGACTFRLPPCFPALTPLFEIVPVQFLTWELARRAGREPGRLRIASTVTLRE